MKAQRMPEGLAKLFEALGMGIAVRVQFDPNSPLSEDEQAAAAIAEAEAEHRKECADCRAEYEANQKQVERREGSAGRRESDLKTERQDAVGEVGTGYEAKDTDKATSSTQPARDRAIVGYMAYFGDEPIHGTFHEDKGVVEDGIGAFTGLAEGNTNLTVQPVYG